MQKLGTFIKKAQDAIVEKTVQAFSNIQADLEQIKVDKEIEPAETSIVQDRNETQQQRIPANVILQDEKVLQIDIVQSNVIRTEEEIKAEASKSQTIQLHQINQNQISNNQGSVHLSRLKKIEQEKRSILEELKKLDEQISVIKGENVEDGALKRRQKQLEKEQAANHAKDLIKQLKMQKKEMEERKRKQAQKTLLILKQQQQQRKARRAEEVERAKQERRKKIEARMEEDRKKKEQRKLIELESNRLIKQLKKEESIMKQKEELPQQTGEIQQKKKVIEKKQEVNFRQIEQHQRRYIQYKDQERSIKKQQRSQSVNHNIPHYKKNMWLEQIEQQEQKRKQQENKKQMMRKQQLEKRKKYGQLVKKVFVPKMAKKQTNEEQPQQRQKIGTPDTVMLPRIPESEKRITDSKQMKKFINQNRPFATAHNPNPKPPRPQQIQKKEEDLEAEKMRKAKQAEIRRQTKERLKKMDNQSLDKLIPPTKSKPKYENYLGRIKPKAEEPTTSWKKVIDNENLSKEDRYKEMLRRAAAMENKAKVKEEVMKEGDEEAVNLYIGSIQAKLAILQKF